MRGAANVIDRSPPHSAHDGGGGGGWAWLVTARGLAEAQLVRGLLEANGIVPVAMDASDPSPGAWLFLSGNINALVRIYVPRSLLDDARLALLDVSVSEPQPPAREQAPPERLPIVSKLMLVAVTLIVIAIYLIAAFRNTMIGT